MASGLAFVADLFYLAALILGLSKFLSWELSKRHEKKRLIHVVTVLICVILAVGAICGNHYLNRHSMASEIVAGIWGKMSPLMPKPEQQRVLAELDELFATQGESDLFQMFDFRLMMTTNITIATEILKNNKFDWRPYYFNKESLIDTNIAGNDMQRHGGGINLSISKNKVDMIVLPAKYTQNKKLLLRFENSTVLPTAVIDAVKEFDVAVADNAQLLIKVLNDALQTNPDYYLHYDDMSSSQYWHAIDGMYLPRFTQLRPKADKIREAIRQSLNTK